MPEITRVPEKEWPTRPPTAMFADLPQSFWDARPHLWDPAGGRLVSRTHTWVVRVNGLVVLVDTGIGDGKDRPEMPAFHRLETGFTARLAEAGVEPGDVDVVVNTHLHADHVGWNTTLAGGEWVPAFPRATYLFPAADYEHFRGDPVVADSVQPVLDAGQAVLWRDGHRITDDLVLEPAPGHTPGSSVLKLRDDVVFVGDLLHNPAQALEPDSNSMFCLDAAEARSARRRVLGWAADHGALVLPAHFEGGPVVREGAGFAFA
ncbi:MBL fold metallo-hydrolase [Amycolatopsis sp. WQ 127309]|uniref:MBL fold metallo-hydrolase n=1 Tax=Amycolatopsis sp. WQ 127309 TaxID=2932773 RepID=UPI001FF6D1CD|nr:MBL fold metallo-hydrolase [Amycolatopsis sp. WQ 127309]UOZ05586.1 MBL fold metallo-hydrolase [Amycolatopsis sp. WQ 127309]